MYDKIHYKLKKKKKHFLDHQNNLCSLQNTWKVLGVKKKQKTKNKMNYIIQNWVTAY